MVEIAKAFDRRGNLVHKLRRLAARPPQRTFAAITSALKRSPRPVEAVSNAPALHPFDELYAIDTRGGIDEGRSRSVADAHNVGYGPSNMTVARAAIEAVPAHGDMTFIDFGCGKGRVLVLATEYGFPRIVGLELSPCLGEAARKIADTVAERHPDRTRVEVVVGDGLAFDLPPGPILLYMYHPAYDGLLKKLVRKLADHQAASAANKVFVVYANPAAARVFDTSRAFKRFFAARVKLDPADQASNIFGSEEESVVAWQSVSATMHPAHPGANAPVRRTGWGDWGTVQSETTIQGDR